MAHRRYRIDLAIPEVIPPALLEKPTVGQLSALADMTWIQIFKTIINRLQQYSEKINAGTQNEENTTIAKVHICRHADGQPCDPESDIK